MLSTLRTTSKQPGSGATACRSHNKACWVWVFSFHLQTYILLHNQVQFYLASVWTLVPMLALMSALVLPL